MVSSSRLIAIFAFAVAVGFAAMSTEALAAALAAVFVAVFVAVSAVTSDSAVFAVTSDVESGICLTAALCPGAPCSDAGDAGVDDSVDDSVDERVDEGVDRGDYNIAATRCKHWRGDPTMTK